MRGPGDRARALFFVFLLISFAIFLYLVHVHRQSEVSARKGAAPSLFDDVERFFGSGVSEEASSAPLPAVPQSIPVRQEKERLMATVPVRIGDVLVEGVGFLYRQEEKWLIVERAISKEREYPCRGVMREGATHLLVWECGGKKQKTIKE